MPLAGTTDKILVSGFNLESDTGDLYRLVRLNYDGTPDSAFTPWGAPGGFIGGIRVYLNDPIFGNNVRLGCSYPKNPDGTGGTYYMLLLDPNLHVPDKYHPPIAFIGDETVDGPIVNMARQNIDGKFLIHGQFKNVYNTATSSWVPRNRVARLESDGKTLDPSYDVGVGPNGVVIQIFPMKNPTPPSTDYDDRMMVVGNFTTWNGAPCGFIMRLTTDGAVDPTFTPGTGADDRIWLNWKADGTGGWVNGYFRSYNGQPRGGITGLNADGSPNTSFSNIIALAGMPGMVCSLATQPDGKILIGGGFNGAGGKARGSFARLNPDGSLDPSLTSALVDGTVKSVAVLPDGKILLGGIFGQCQNYLCTSLVRLHPDGSFDQTFKPGNDIYLNNINHIVPLANGQIMIGGEIRNAAESPPAMPRWPVSTPTAAWTPPFLPMSPKSKFPRSIGPGGTAWPWWAINI